MKLQRFFLGSALEDQTTVRIPSLDLMNQLKNVFRLKTGDKVVLFDNSGVDFTMSIDGYDKEAVTFTLIEKHPNNVIPIRETYLFASIVKKDNFEWIAEKATELGVAHIIPVISERSEKKSLNLERLQKIVIEASEQSGRGTVPKISEIMELEEVIRKYSSIKSIAWEPTAEKFIREDLESVQGIYIGPEGGWTPAELELFTKNNIPVRSLGPQILRAETAVIAALSQIVF